MPLENPLALLGFLSIIPLIIIYLIRPKPKEILFSSVLFLREGNPERSAVLSRLINDPLFWVQVLVLCTLSVAAAGPYITTPETGGSHLAIVLDYSASMQNSFSHALEMIAPYLNNYDRISIILAETLPVIALQARSGEEASDTLNKLSPRAVSADLSSAIVQASNLLGPEGGNVIVLSDFISWTGDDPEATRKLLEADGRVGIIFADSYVMSDNVALVGGWDVPGPGYVNHTALVHNYGKAKRVPITITGPGGSSSQNANIPEGGDFYLSFTAYPGVNKITLELQDGINWDNNAYVYVPDLGEKKVLYLGEEGPALIALRSLPNVQVETSGDYSNFDLVVIAKNASQDGKLNRYIDSGGKVVFVASETDESPEYLPVRVTGDAQGPANLWIRNQGFAEGLHFDEIGLFDYLETAPRRHSTIMVEANGAPVLSYWRLGQGIVIYNGLEKGSDFYTRPEYPIFWYLMVNWLTGVPDIAQSNRKTGELIPMGEMTKVETPSGPIITTNLLLDEVGVYRFYGDSLAANMYDSRESDLGRTASYIPMGKFQEGSRETLAKQDLSNWLIALAALAILMELAIMRWRREA